MDADTLKNYPPSALPPKRVRIKFRDLILIGVILVVLAYVVKLLLFSPVQQAWRSFQRSSEILSDRDLKLIHDEKRYRTRAKILSYRILSSGDAQEKALSNALGFVEIEPELMSKNKSWEWYQWIKGEKIGNWLPQLLERQQPQDWSMSELDLESIGHWFNLWAEQAPKPWAVTAMSNAALQASSDPKQLSQFIKTVARNAAGRRLAPARLWEHRNIWKNREIPLETRTLLLELLTYDPGVRSHAEFQEFYTPIIRERLKNLLLLPTEKVPEPLDDKFPYPEKPDVGRIDYFNDSRYLMYVIFEGPDSYVQLFEPEQKLAFELKKGSYMVGVFPTPNPGSPFMSNYVIENTNYVFRIRCDPVNNNKALRLSKIRTVIRKPPNFPLRREVPQ